jgi:phosphatidylserine/phosphatidylglycerophosphate/cardiolipin synthase-like enzyme
MSSIPAASAKGYTPSAGVKINNPLGSRAERRAIVRHLLRTIDSAPRKSHIRVASWNIRSDAVVDALIRAHKRHVSVRVILDRGNANPDNPNRGINRLDKALRHNGNKSRRSAMRSHLKKCVRSCRGRRGIAHSKFFLFERAGRAHNVVMNGSWNATDLASSNQWNDLFTVRGRPGVYREYKKVFSQMFADKPVRQAYRARHFGGLTTMAFPYAGRNTPSDPAVRELERIRCAGAKNSPDGHTKIRIAQTSWYGERGKKIAWRVRRLQNHGCHVRIIYAVAGNEVLRILRREGPKPVPMRQIVQDWNNDGVYDRYLHTKVMTVRGHYGANHRAWMTINGSANWSPAVLASDEAVMRLSSRGVLQRYNGWIDHLFKNPPRKSRTSSSLAPRASVPGLPGSGDVDPYALIQEN